MTRTNRTVAEAQSRADTSQYLTFLLAGEEYGVDILRVQEIKGFEAATPLPNTPEHVLGVINLRGTVIPIVDLRKRFGLPPAEYGATTVIIVVRISSEDHERTMGLVVDAVSDVYNIPSESVQPPPALAGAVEAEAVLGLSTVESTMVILLDVDRVMAGTLLPQAA